MAIQERVIRTWLEPDKDPSEILPQKTLMWCLILQTSATLKGEFKKRVSQP
jgi:hypothetical protein